MGEESVVSKRARAQPLLDETIFELGRTLRDLAFEAQLLIGTYKGLRSGETISFDEIKRSYTHHSIVEMWTAIQADDLTQKCGVSRFDVGVRKDDKESVAERFQLILNSQLRWLLVSGYEAYEQFLRRLYAEIGFYDSNLWRCSDFGNDKHLKDIESLTRDEFIRLVHGNGGLQPEKICNLLAERFPAIKRYENKITIELCDYKITHREYIKLIAALRHQIVHAQGQVDRDLFFKKLRSDVHKTTPEGFITRSCLRESSGGWEIWLLPKNSLLQESCSLFSAPLRGLLERLGAHASLLYGEAIKYFDHEPFWLRAKEEKG